MNNPIIPLLTIPAVRRFLYPKARKLYTFYSAKYYGKDLQTIRPTTADLDIEETLSMDDMLALRFLITANPETDMCIVEAGSWKGKSTSVLAQAVQGTKSRVYAVDTWLGSDGTWNKEIALNNDIFAIFRRNMMILGYNETVYPLVMPSHVAAGIFPDKSVDMVFIDADHRYEYVKADILAWKQKVKTGGILCGHDCQKRYMEFTLAEQKTIDRNLMMDDLPGIGHPGVIKAVHECLPKYEIYPNSGVWWVKIEANIP